MSHLPNEKAPRSTIAGPAKFILTARRLRPNEAPKTQKGQRKSKAVGQVALHQSLYLNRPNARMSIVLCPITPQSPAPQHSGCYNPRSLERLSRQPTGRGVLVYESLDILTVASAD